MSCRQSGKKVRSESGHCRAAKCDMQLLCPLARARQKMQAANLLVVNHALLFSDLALREVAPGLLGDYDLLVLDEAHTAERVVSDHFGLSVSSSAGGLRSP